MARARPETGALPRIEELLLQRHEMLLLDRLVAYGSEHVEAALRVPAEHPLLLDSQGLPAWVGIELMAQAVSVFSGLELRARGQGPRIGLLLGTRMYEAFVPLFPCGMELAVRANLALRDAAGLGVFDCEIRAAQQLLARARVKGFMPEDVELFLKADIRG